MDFKKYITLKISSEEMKKIIVDYLKREGYCTKSDDVKFLLDKKYEGHYPYESLVYRFVGCEINIVED